MSRDITLCHPELQKKAAELVEKCRQQGLIIKITDCLRNEQEQADCVKRGTSSLSYPHSHHNWGTAFDFCRNDGQGAYKDNDGFFTKVGKVGQSIGLEWGGNWYSPVDKPHFQLPDWGTGTIRLELTYKTPENFKKTWVTDVEDKEVRYNTVDEIPEWGKATINKLINTKAIADKNNLDLSEDMLRVLVIIDRQYS